MEEEKKLYSTKEAADYLGVSIRTFKYWIKNQNIQPVQTGAKGAKFYSEVQLKNFRCAKKDVQPVQLGVQNDELHTSTYATTCAIAHVEGLEVQTTRANVNQNCTPDNKKVDICTPEPVQNLDVQHGVQPPVQNNGDEEMTTEIINETKQMKKLNTFSILVAEQMSRLDTTAQRINQAETFLDTIYTGVEYRVFGYLHTLPARKSYSFDISNKQERRKMAEMAIKLNDELKQNVYFGVCPTANKLEEYHRASFNPKEGEEPRPPVLQPCIWVDIDVEGGTHKPNEKEKLAPDVNVARTLAKLKPSFIIFTGGGLHFYYLLEKPLDIKQDNYQELQQRNKDFLDVLRQNEGGYKIDAVDDLPRVMRLPGTFNLGKDAKIEKENAKICCIVENHNITYSIDLIDKFIKDNLHQEENIIDSPAPAPQRKFNNDINDIEFEQAKIERALDYIDPASVSYEDWLNVGKALKSADCDMSLWDRWSAKDTARYKGINEISYKWNSFTGSGITIATLFNLAQNSGFDIKAFWYEYHNINSNSAQDYSDNETVNSNIFISLYQQKKYKEAQQKAIEILQAFVDADNFTIKTVHDETLLTAAAITKKGNLETISIFEEFKAKCKKSKAIPLTGNGGLVQLTDKFYDKLETIKRNFNKEKFEHEQEIKNKASQKDFKEKVNKGEIEAAPLPLDKIKMPEGFQFDLKRMVTTQTQLDKEGLPCEVVAFRSINIISKIIKNADDKIQKLEISSIKAGDKHWTHCTAEREFFATSHKITSLSNFGFNVTSNTSSNMIKFLDEFEHLNYQLIPSIKTVNQTGWRGNDEFVYPNNNSGNYQLDDKVNMDIEQIFQSKGDKSIIIDLLKKVKKDDTLNCVIGATLAAPLVQPLNIDNIAIHIFGLAGSGKSTISKLALSLFCNPYAPRALPSADSTKVGFELFFQARHDLPAFLEDISGVKDDKFKKVVEALPYQFVNKVGRLRGTKNIRLANLADFRGSLITNGEKPLNSDSASGGGLRRLIEIQGKDKMVDRNFAAEIVDTIRENYGLFGKDWIDFIKNHKDEIKEYFNKIARSENGLRQKFKNKIPLHIDSLTAIVVANIFFDIHFLGINEETARNNEIFSIINILKTLPNEVEIADFERVKPIIRNWILGHQKYFLQESDDGKAFNSTNENYGVERKEFYAIYPEKIKELLTKEGFAAEMIMKQLAKDKFIDCDEGRTTKIIRINEKTVRLCVFLKNKIFTDSEQKP